MYLFVGRLVWVLIPFLFLTCKSMAELRSTSPGYGDYRDVDWNTTFYDNAGMPSRESVKWVTNNKETFLRFRLKDGDIGKAPSDPVERRNIKYMERAELKARNYFKKDSRYDISFSVRFVEGFKGKKEYWFQIHQWLKNCYDQRPPVLLSFDRSILRMDTLLDEKSRENYKSNIEINELYGKWNEVKMYLDLKDNFISISFNENIIFNEKIYVSKCGAPHIKFGIYRGRGLKRNAVSSIDFDKISVEKRIN